VLSASLRTNALEHPGRRAFVTGTTTGFHGLENPFLLQVETRTLSNANRGRDGWRLVRRLMSAVPLEWFRTGFYPTVRTRRLAAVVRRGGARTSDGFRGTPVGANGMAAETGSRERTVSTSPTRWITLHEEIARQCGFRFPTLSPVVPDLQRPVRWREPAAPEVRASFRKLDD